MGDTLPTLSRVFECSSATRMPQMRDGVHVGAKNLTGRRVISQNKYWAIYPNKMRPAPANSWIMRSTVCLSKKRIGVKAKIV